MVSPIILSGSTGPRFFFNLDGNVGPKCPNRPDDVQLVQLGYVAYAKNSKAQLTQAQRALFAKVVPGSPYTGAASDPLTLAINEHEVLRGGPRDGHVSVARSPGTYDATHTYIVIALNNNLRDTMLNDFPRIDKNAQCPGGLQVKVRNIVVGTS
jgi:hypothetical protein